ncbi:MAG TPA: cyclic nucleotide-binding domain-containing protein [Gemmataceae bacterium]|nr:cyclic nucleotide-binding domain-containing protein [Gemmataceae bacterium]
MTDVTDSLRRYPLFALLEPGPLAAWLAGGLSRSVDLGETLLQAGTEGRAVYLVEQGRVRVQRPGRAREVSLGVYGPGEVFGEYALLPPGLNTATCRASGPGRVLRLPLEPLHAWLAERPEVRNRLKRWLRLHALLGYLRDEAFLGFMSATSFLPLLDLCQKVDLRAGCAIQADGLGADVWFVVRGGRVRLSSPGGPPRALGPGDCFGERALLGLAGLPLAEAESDAECLALRRDAFEGRQSAGAAGSLQTQCAAAEPAGYGWVAQQDANDCGAAALAMVARQHGLDVSPGDVRGRLRLGARGASLLEMQQAAAALDLGGRPVRVGIEQLPLVAYPAVALLEGGHYVVLFALGMGAVVVGDPARGVVTMDLVAFRQAWGGHLLLMTAPAAGKTI